METANDNRAGGAFVAVGLIATSQPVFLPGNTPTLVALGVLAVGCIWLVLVHGQRLVIPIPLLLFMLWAVVSVGWVGYIASSANAVLTLLFVTLIAAKCATFDPVTIMRGLQLGGMIILLLSLALAVVRPSEGLVTDVYNQGALQGVYSHRNSLASVLAVGFAAALSRFAAQDGKRWLALVSLTFLGGGILATQSSSALAVASITILIVIAVSIARRVGRAGRVLVGLGSVIIVVYTPLWLYSLFAQVTTVLGRDLTLTGRTFIWDSAWEWIVRRPFLGHGWGGVWPDGHLVGDAIRRSFGWDSASSAHNGFLDILLHVGVVGLALYVCVLLPAIIRSMRVALSDPMNTWMIAILGIFVAYNIVESRAIRPNGEFLIALVAGAALNTVLETRGAALSGTGPGPEAPRKARRQAVRAGLIFR